MRQLFQESFKQFSYLNEKGSKLADIEQEAHEMTLTYTGNTIKVSSFISTRQPSMAYSSLPKQVHEIVSNT